MLTGMPFSRCGRTKVPYNWLKADFERPWKERLIMLPLYPEQSMILGYSDRFNVIIILLENIQAVKPAEVNGIKGTLMFNRFKNP